MEMETQKAAGGKSARTGLRQLQVEPLWALLGIALVLISLTLASLQAPHPNAFEPFLQRSWFDRVRYPIERNAVQRLQVVPIAINGASFLQNGQRGWAVGDNGQILATSDSGRTWTAQTSGALYKLSAVQFNADGQRGWVVGDGGTILATGDGGRTWAAQRSGVMSHLSAVHFNTDRSEERRVGKGCRSWWSPYH